MIYFKSALAGIVTVVTTALFIRAAEYAYAQTRMWADLRANPGDTYFVVVHLNLFSAAYLVAALAVFMCGAYWMFRRLRLQQ